MKEGWIIERLDKLCVIKDKYRKPITKSKRESGPYPYYGATGLLDYVKEYIFDEKLVLLGEDGAKWGAGEISAYSIYGRSWVNNHAHVLSPKDNLLHEWLIYYLNYADLTDYITGVTVPKLNQEKMSSIPIPLPPLPEQQRIVDYLDKTFAEIDTLKAKAAEEVANAKAMFDAALKEEMTPKEGWEEKTLGEICSINSKLVSPLDDQYKHLIHVGGANIESHKGNLIELKTAAEEKLESGKYYFDDRVVLYNKIRPYLVKVARPNFSGLCSADMYPLNPNSHISRDYLFYILISDTFTEYAIKGSARAGMPKVNREHLFAYSCMIPPIPVQQRIVAHLDSLRSLLTELEQKYAKIAAECDALKQALLRETFE